MKDIIHSLGLMISSYAVWALFKVFPTRDFSLKVAVLYGRRYKQYHPTMETDCVNTLKARGHLRMRETRMQQS